MFILGVVGLLCQYYSQVIGCERRITGVGCLILKSTHTDTHSPCFLVYSSILYCASMHFACLLTYLLYADIIFSKLCYKISFRALTAASKGILVGRVFSYEAFRVRLAHLVNSSDVTNCIIFLQDEVCCCCWSCFLKFCFL